jgi:hypothetical protein
VGLWFRIGTLLVLKFQLIFQKGYVLCRGVIARARFVANHLKHCLTCRSSQCQKEWLPNDEVSNSTFHTGFKSACHHSNMHPVDVENRACFGTRTNPEFDAHHPDQVVFSPTESKADGSIDIMMGNRDGDVITQTEIVDATAWRQSRNLRISCSNRMFDWENHLRGDSTLSSVFEYVMKVSIKNKLALEDITVFPKRITRATEKAMVVQMWSQLLDKYLDSSREKRNDDLVDHARKLMATYMSGDGMDSAKRPTDITRKSRKRGVSKSLPSFRGDYRRGKHKMKKRGNDPKSKLIVKSAQLAAARRMDYSKVSMSSGSSSLVNIFAKRVEDKNGVVMIDVDQTFADNFSHIRVKLRQTQSPIRTRSKSFSRYLVFGIDNRTNNIVPSGDCSHLPTPVGKTDDDKEFSTLGRYWYGSKRTAKLAFMWYCLYSISDDQWRKKWLLHLIGDGNDEVQACWKNFQSRDSTFTLDIEQTNPRYQI